MKRTLIDIVILAGLTDDFLRLGELLDKDWYLSYSYSHTPTPLLLSHIYGT